MVSDDSQLLYECQVTNIEPFKDFVSDFVHGVFVELDAQSSAGSK